MTKPKQKIKPNTEVPTLRDQFAMAALTGMMANPKLIDDDPKLMTYAMIAYVLAELMLNVRKKMPKSGLNS